MKTATLVGYHGRKNFGDDIFREIVIRWLDTVLGVSKCHLTAGKGTVEPTLSGVAVHTFSSPVKRISRLLWLSIFVKAMRSDYLIFSAGSIFTILPFVLVYMVIRILKWMRADSLKIMAIGVSIGPFKSDFDRYWCFKSLNLMDHILLRDLKSKKLLDNSGVDFSCKLSYDLALCWHRMFVEPEQNKQPGLIGIALTPRGFGNCMEGKHSHNCNAIIEAVDEAMNQHAHARVRILSLCSDEVDGDVALCDHIHSRWLKWGSRVEMVVYNGKDIDAFLLAIHECSLMIASRMHAGIMAMSASVLLYQISYAEKITSFFEHCELSTAYVYNNDQVTKESLNEFLQQGMLNKLTISSDELTTRLKKLGDIVYCDLEGYKNI